MRKSVLAFLVCFMAYFSAGAQETFPVNGTTDPRHTTYAIIHAKVHVDYQTMIDSATLIFRDGKIVEVGKSISIPAGAVVFDAAGKHVYPSLIDAFSDYGLPEVKRETNFDRYPQFISNTKGAYDWNQAVRSEFEVNRNFAADSKKAEEMRKLGFGMVNSIMRDGIFRGTSSVVLLSDARENDLIVKDRSAANYSFDKGSSTQDYPSSLMGSIALIRQSFYDAQWYAGGGKQKEYNISLEAINNQKDLPQIFEANDKQNDLRVARIGKEFGINFIVKGGGNEYERISEVSETGCPLILPLNFPDAFDFTDAYDVLNVPIRQMKEWELAPSNPSMVAAAKIPFAITTSDLKSKADFWKNLRKAIDNGLSEADALKSLTATPAALLKIDDKAGSLKKGMMANFLITSKSLFDKDNFIYENWINGKRYQFADMNQADIRGNYSLTIAQQKPMRMQIAGADPSAADVSVYEDTTAVKAQVIRQGTMITLQFELKKSAKGTYRLTGSTQGNIWTGNVLLPDGSWNKWTAKLDSAFVPPVAKADTSKRDTTRGTVWYPNMAYGFKELPKAANFVIRHATVWTNEAEGILTDADVYVSNGKISAVGKNLSVPANTEEIDGKGKHLTSGIIDEHSHIAVSDDVNEGTQSSSAEVRIGDVVDADDIQIYRQLAGGVTCSHLLHGSANAIGGQTQLIKLRWGSAPEKLKFEGWPGFIKFALGENVKQSHWGDKQVLRFPQTRMGVEQVYMDYFTRAKEYSLAWKKYNADAKKQGAAPRRNIELDALAEILDSKRFITCHSYEQSEINMLMHVADTFGFKVNTFTHILEGYKVADKMKAHGLRGASTFSDWWAYKYEVYEAIPYNGALMYRMGLNVSYNSDDPEMARRLNQEAAKAVKYGNVPEADAWKFVTLNPAKMLHVDDKVGSIKVGKDADLVLWTDNPLSIYSRPVYTFVDGIKYFDLQRDADLQKDIAAERGRLLKKMSDAKNKGESTQKPSMKATEIKHCDGSEFILIR